MKKTIKIVLGIFGALALTGLCSISAAYTSGCRTCDEVTPGSPQEVRIEYKDGTTRSACGLRCAGAMLAAYRMQDVRTIWVREHGSGNGLDAKKAFWSLGQGEGSRKAFSGRPDAEAFTTAHGGRVVNFKETMAAVFSEMFDVLQKTQLLTNGRMSDDVTVHPKCDYCGMDRKQYAYSRVLIKYNDGSEAGLCSVHCAGIDLALHPEKEAVQIMAGAFDSGDLVGAEKAIWVLGGSKQGVMSIRGKWAFKRKEDAEEFIREFGGAITSFRDVMTAAFEDMWEIIR